MYWDALLILRRTGMRFEDLAHLKAPDAHGRDGCLVQDSDGYWWIRIDHRFTKMGRDHRIPTRQSDGVIAAIGRQRARIGQIPNYFNEHYLFRHERGVLAGNVFNQALRNKLAPHLLHEGQPYPITAYQFRHTIATEMIEQGIDIYTVKEFLGHQSLGMTERYIKLYLKSLKAKYDAYRAKQQQARQHSPSPHSLPSRLPKPPPMAARLSRKLGPCIALPCQMASGGANISPCSIPARPHRIVHVPQAASEHASFACVGEQGQQPAYHCRVLARQSGVRTCTTATRTRTPACRARDHDHQRGGLLGWTFPQPLNAHGSNSHLNAQARSQQKRRAAFEALAVLQQEQRTITKGRWLDEQACHLSFYAAIRIWFRRSKKPNEPCQHQHPRTFLSSRPKIRLSLPCADDWTI